MRSILDDPSLTRWTWAVLALLLAATAFLTIQGRWLGVAVLGGTVACSVAFIRLQDRLPRLFNLLFVLAGAVNAAAYVFDLWARIGVYDEFVHFYTTFAVAAAFGYLAFHRPHLSDAGRLWRFVAVVAAFGFGVGVLWEVFEWAVGMIGDRVDTVVDLVMDILGAATAGLFCAWAINPAARRERGTPARDDSWPPDVTEGEEPRRHRPSSQPCEAPNRTMSARVLKPSFSAPRAL